MHSSLAEEYSDTPIYLTDEKAFFLLSPSVLEREFELTQIIEGRYKDTEYFLQTWISADTTSIEQTAFNSMGIEMFSLSFSDSGYSFSSGFFSGNGNPLYMLADFQLIYFPWDVVARVLTRAGFSADEESIPGGWRRRVGSGNEVVIEIERRGSRVYFKNYLRDYEYSIDEQRSEE